MYGERRREDLYCDQKANAAGTRIYAARVCIYICARDRCTTVDDYSKTWLGNSKRTVSFVVPSRYEHRGDERARRTLCWTKTNRPPNALGLRRTSRWLTVDTTWKRLPEKRRIVDGRPYMIDGSAVLSPSNSEREKSTDSSLYHFRVRFFIDVTGNVTVESITKLNARSNEKLENIIDHLTRADRTLARDNTNYITRTYRKLFLQVRR